jgi:S-(hydroxymethyl)glutathione dehydrogenase/alcohol dehydrogenase
MRAAVCRTFGKPLVIEDVVLEPPGEGELKVKVAACAVCHSDIIY